MPQDTRVTAGGLLHGDPADQAYLKPDAIRSTKNSQLSTDVEIWELGQPHMFETWLYCQYGEGLQLFQKVDPRATICSATGKRQRGALNELVFICK
ncbi:hypothetical protein LZ005_15875 [Massilia sp. TS11]|nr:hypothetical protein [Massilia sp. TS11]